MQKKTKYLNLKNKYYNFLEILIFLICSSLQQNLLRGSRKDIRIGSQTALRGAIAILVSSQFYSRRKIYGRISPGKSLEIHSEVLNWPYNFYVSQKLLYIFLNYIQIYTVQKKSFNRDRVAMHSIHYLLQKREKPPLF